MIYTSNYFNPKTNNYRKISISVSTPKGYGYDFLWKTVAPDWFELLKPYKEGIIDDEEYTRRYLIQLNGKKEQIIQEYKELLKENSVLLCWCKKGNFCHRRILARWLEEQGFDEIKEL